MESESDRIRLGRTTSAYHLLQSEGAGEWRQAFRAAALQLCLAFPFGYRARLSRSPALPKGKLVVPFHTLVPGPGVAPGGGSATDRRQSLHRRPSVPDRIRRGDYRVGSLYLCSLI